jgi:hypothetical protein
MNPEDWMDVAEANLTPVVRMIISESVDRGGNYTCLAVTDLGIMVSMGQVAN